MIYDDEVFKMACDQFQVIADYLNIDQERSRPAHVSEARDGRHAAGAHGRRQHADFPGLSRAASPHARPDQRRHAFRAESFHGRNRRARHVDELEMRAGQFALRRRERRHRLRSDQAFAQRTRSGLAPLHAGDDPVRRPADRHHGPGHGDERAGDGLVHGHLFGLSGLLRERNRHRQTGLDRRHGRPARRRPDAASFTSSSARWTC